MLKITTENLRHIYFSGKEVQCQLYIPDNIAYLWDASGYYDKEDAYIYLVSPSTMLQYQDFVDNIEKHQPLLAELR